jgi:hypothetical protein
MTNTPEELISLFLFDSASMTQDQAEAFSKWILQNPGHVREFINSALMHRGIHDYFYSIDTVSKQILKDDMNDSLSNLQNLFEKDLWNQLSREEREAPTLELPKDACPDPQLLLSEDIEHIRHTAPNRPLWASMISMAAVFLLVVFYVFTHPRHFPQNVATVLDVYQTQWADPSVMIQKGDRLTDDNNSFYLKKGVIKILFDNGARVVIQGPAQFSLEDYERMNLTYGKLYAMAPSQAIGFRVNTPNCGVIDLGTEFGVNVTDQGETSVHLFKGKAAVATSSQGQTHSQILLRQEATSVNAYGEIQAISFQERAFVRDFDSQNNVLWTGEKLCLASIASGGNGLDITPSTLGIDIKTGRLVFGNNEEHQTAQAGYILVPSLSFVDGVFMPDGGNGPVQLTSAGHTFDGFNDNDGDYYMSIGAHSHINMVTATGRQYTTLSLEGYPKDTTAMLCLHANSGITFDLQKIREAMPFAKITRFTSGYGISKTSENVENATSDFYVFVDGVPRLSKTGFSNEDKPGHLSIDLAPTDRFLTLACTEGDNNYADWSLFANPTLELELVN